MYIVELVVHWLGYIKRLISVNSSLNILKGEWLIDIELFLNELFIGNLG